MKVKPYKYLHRPFRLVWFESDELMLILIGIFLSFVVYVWSFLLFIALVYGMKKAKPKLPRGFIKHIAYYLGVYRFKGYPVFFTNKFIE